MSGPKRMQYARRCHAVSSGPAAAVMWSHQARQQGSTGQGCVLCGRAPVGPDAGRGAFGVTYTAQAGVCFHGRPPRGP